MNSLKNIVFIVSLTIVACTKEDNFPDTHVEEAVWVNSPQYSHVYGNPWGWDTIPGGIGGIIFVQQPDDTFVAYDRACTVEANKDCIVSVTDDQLIFSCHQCCNSKFIITDGSVSEGSANQALKRYNTYFDGDYLYITN